VPPRLPTPMIAVVNLDSFLICGKSSLPLPAVIESRKSLVGGLGDMLPEWS
jgi:hypothetical protein